MPSARASNQNPDALLCERCGYAIAGLRETQACPECGQAAGSSWPNQRPGSHYQTSRTIAGRWLRGNVEVLRSPNRLFRRVQINPQSCLSLLVSNLTLTSALVAFGYSSGNPWWLQVTAVVLCVTFALLVLLTFIETVGLRLFARAESRQWRVTADVAWTVCNHASVGWLIAGVLMLIIYLVDPVERLVSAQWLNTYLYRHWNGTLVSDYLPQLRVAQVMIPFITGMLTFETLVYLGIRQCRFANTPASASQQGVTPSAEQRGSA